MQTSFFSGDICLTDSDAIIVGHFKGQALTGSALKLDQASDGAISSLIESGDLAHKTNKIRSLFNLPGIRASRIIVIGLGDAEKFDLMSFRQSVNQAVSRLMKSPASSTILCLPELAVQGLTADEAILHAGIACHEATYVYRATKKQEDITGLVTIALCNGQADLADGTLEQADAIGQGVNRARELGNLPPNICNPDFLAATAGEIAGAYKNVSLNVLHEDEMDELGMGSLMAVARGSRNRPKLIVLKYSGAGDAQPHILVGKGITFDSGGISLKPGAGMDEMKYDMCGAASVFGAFQAVAAMQLAVNLIMIVPAVENMPDGDAYRPGDVLTSYSGKTIEVLNTDAEGRLILCDALTYGGKMEPASMIDVATLTGACVIALGHHASGLMTKHDDLAQELLAAGEVTGDRAWRLPLWDDYQPQIDSPFADIANVGGREAGSITAGCFLSRFTDGIRWAHLDIAGSAWKSGKNRDATGRPVKLLVQYIQSQAG